MNEETRIQRVLDFARDEIVRLNPYRALEYLRSITSEVDDRQGTPISAEYQLLLADAYAAQGDPGAEAYFEEALHRACNLSDRDAALEMRAHDDFAKFLASVEHRRSAARLHNESAKNLAIKLGRSEDAARLQLRILKLDLESDDDVRLSNFQQLRKAGKELGSSYQRQLAAWFQYSGEHQEGSRGRVAARNADRASIQYFRHLLSSIT
jgi:hypothetical protein